MRDVRCRAAGGVRGIRLLDDDEVIAMDVATPDANLLVLTERGYGTVSSSLIALPAPAPAARAHWRFADGRPDTVPYKAVSL